MWLKIFLADTFVRLWGTIRFVNNALSTSSIISATGIDIRLHCSCQTDRMFLLLSVISTNTCYLYSYIASTERLQFRLLLKESGWLREEKQCHHWSTHIPRSLHVTSPICFQACTDNIDCMCRRWVQADWNCREIYRRTKNLKFHGCTSQDQIITDQLSGVDFTELVTNWQGWNLQDWVSVGHLTARRGIYKICY